MAKHDFSKVRALIGEQSPILRKGIRHALFSMGFRDIVDCSSFADVYGHLDRGAFDLMVVNSELETNDTTFLIREVRRGAMHKDPFLVVLLVMTRADQDHIKLAMHSGADDLLLVPFSPDQMMQRMALVHQKRKPFVVTHDYIGPDRRRAPRPGEASAVAFAVPNPYLSRSSGVPDERYMMQVRSTVTTLGRARVASLVKAAEWELRAVANALAAGPPPDDLATRLYRVDKICEELLDRLRGKMKVEAIQEVRQRCRDLCCDTKGATSAALAGILRDAKGMVSEWQLEHVFSGAAPPPSPAAPVVAAPPTTGAPRDARDKDVTYALPPELAHLLKHIEYDAPEPPPPLGGFTRFDDLCEAAILRRIDRVVTFFHRRNAGLERGLPPIFLLSPLFAEKFRQAVIRFILPGILGSRQVRMLAASLDCASVDTDTFWDNVPSLLKASILESWNAGWDELKLVAAAKEDGTRALQVKEPTKQLREVLQPASPSDYDLPRVTNREIEIFRSLLDPATDWAERLSVLWRSCHDLYEQEKDPRAFQQQVREGALRDNLLAAFRNFPDQWADFVILTCHRVFPRIDSQFLEKFSTNFGRGEAEREAHMPYLIRTLRQVHDRPEIRRKERDAEAEWAVREQALRNYFKGSASSG